MKNMTKKQLTGYLNNIQFGVLNFEKTRAKWGNYKESKWQLILEEIKDNYLDWLSDHTRFRYEVFERSMNPYYFELLRDDLKNNFCKTNIKAFKAPINGHMRGYNKRLLAWEAEYIKNVGELSEAEQNTFSIRLYLEFYNKINEVMKKILVDIVTEIYESLEN